MTDYRIADLTEDATPAAGSLIELQSGGVSKRTTIEKVADFVRSALGTKPARRTLVHPGYVAGRWYSPWIGATPSNGSYTTGFITLVPFVPAADCTVSDLGQRVTTAVAGSLFSMAIYASDPATLSPTNLIAFTGDISGAAGATVSGALNANAVLSGGVAYWIGINCNNASLGLLVFSGPGITGALYGSTAVNGFATLARMAYRVASPYGTWPATLGAITTAVVGEAFAFLKIAA